MEKSTIIPVLWIAENSNFGDILSRYIVEHVTGLRAIQSNRNTAEKKLFAIGSIIDIREVFSEQNVIWGSGSIKALKYFGGKLFPINRFLLDKLFLLKNMSNTSRATVCALRGALTRENLLKFGVDSPAIYGDPAILLPKYVKVDGSKARSGSVGLVVHLSHEKLLEIAEVYSKIDVKVINIRRETNNDIESFVQEMANCERIFTSSLHGLIVAQVYDIPCLWFQVKHKRIHSSPNFKFWDYFTGTRQEIVSPIIVENLSKEAILYLKKQACIKNNAVFMSDALLNAFPFKEFGLI